MQKTNVSEIWPHGIAKPMGRDNWHVVYGILHLGLPEPVRDDERTEALAQEHPQLKRERRQLWVVPGGQKTLASYLGMSERSIRNCLRYIERTWFPDGGFFAIWRKDSAKKRQEVNAYDVDELRTRVECRLAHPTLPLEEAIKLAPNEFSQASLPLEELSDNPFQRPAGAVGRDDDFHDPPVRICRGRVEGRGAEPQGVPAAGPEVGAPPPPRDTSESAPEAGVERAAGVGAGAAMHERAGASEALEAFTPPPDTFSHGGDRGGDGWRKGCTERPHRLGEAGLAGVIRAIHEGFVCPIDAEAALRGGETAPRKPHETSGGEGSVASGETVEGQPTASGVVHSADAEWTEKAGGRSCRQVGETDPDRDKDHSDPETTRAREATPKSSRRRRQGRRVVASPEILAKAQLIRKHFPGFWPAEAISWAQKHSTSHLELCLQYVGIERQHRRIDNVLGYLREVFRTASPASMRRRLAQEQERLDGLRRRAEVRHQARPSADEVAAVRQHYEQHLRDQEHRQAPESSPPVLEVKPLGPISSTEVHEPLFPKASGNQEDSMSLPSRDAAGSQIERARDQARALGIDVSRPWFVWLAELEELRVLSVDA